MDTSNHDGPTQTNVYLPALHVSVRIRICYRLEKENEVVGVRVSVTVARRDRGRRRGCTMQALVV